MGRSNPRPGHPASRSVNRLRPNPFNFKHGQHRWNVKQTSRSLEVLGQAPPALWLICVTTGFVLFAGRGMPAHGISTTNTIEFAKSLAQPGTVQWEVNQNLNQQQQESYRKRLSIPDAASPFVPRAVSANLINGPKIPPVHPPSGAGAIERFFHLCFFAAILLLSGGLLARRFAPELLADFNQNIISAKSPAGATGSSTKLSRLRAFGGGTLRRIPGHFQSRARLPAPWRRAGNGSSAP